jgi:hypothetical protein
MAALRKPPSPPSFRRGGLAWAALAVAVGIPPGLAAQEGSREGWANDPPVPPPSVAWLAGGDGILGAGEALHFSLSRPLAPGEGRVVLVVGGTDVSSLLEVDGTRITYRPPAQGLPRGESEVQVYLLLPDDSGWEEVGSLLLRVQVAPGVDRATFAPRLSLSNKGQLAQGQFPDPGSGDRDTFQDFTGQVDLTGDLLRGAGGLKVEANLVGVSRREEALRFREMEGEAPRLDLSRYQLRLTSPQVGLHAGHLSAGTLPDLIRGYSARGVEVAARPTEGLEVSFSALQGSGTVGWSPLLGLGDPGHRLLTARLGGDLLQNRPGRLLLEGHALDGSRLARSSFGRGEIRDTESSRGFGFRLQGATPRERFRMEVTLARSRFNNPPDARVSPEVLALSRPDEAKNALRMEAGLVMVEGVELPRGLRGAIRAGYRWGQVDPLYRSVGSFVRADQMENALDLQGSAGPVALRYTLDRSVDNLDRIPSILRTRSHRHSVDLSLPLRNLPGPGGARVDRSALLPAVTWRYNRTHQFGVNDPIDGGFEPSHIPDQMNDAHNLGLSWQARRLRLGLRGGWTFQDNRQPGREGDDFRNLTAGGSLSLNAHSRFDLSLDGSREEAENRGQARTDVTWSGNVSLTARPGWETGLRVSFAPTRVRDHQGLRERTSTSLNAELSRRVRLPFAGAGSGGAVSVGRREGSAFLRFARRTSTRVDRVLELEDRTRAWTLTSGLSLNLF